MRLKSSITAENVARYVNTKITKESELESRLRRETEKLPEASKISSADVGAFLGMLAQSIRARAAIEIGVFTGYSSLKIASALPPDGKLIACDISEEWANIGRPFWLEAGIESKIDLRIAPAVETLQSLMDQGGAGGFDFIFIDADKPGYDSYYEASLHLLRSGGIIVLDNMLWQGAVADETTADPVTKSLQALNLKISQDRRVQSCLLTVGDGLMMVRKND